jgi:hypothetical protein
MAHIKAPKFSRPGILKKVKAKNLLTLLKPFRSYLEGSGFEWPKAADRLDHEKLANVLASPRPDTPPELVDSLELVDVLSDEQQLFDFESGYGAIVSEVQERDDTAADIALKILLYSPDVAWKAFDKRAVRVKRSLASYLAGPESTFREPTKERVKKLEAQMAPWFESNNRSDACRVHALKEDGGWAFVIRHGDPVSRVGTITEKGESSSMLFRPERLDVAFYNPESREWLISGASRPLKEMYQQFFGDALHGSPRALSPSNRYALDPLHQGPGVLAESGVEAVRAAFLKEVVVMVPAGVRVALKKGDVFAELMRQRALNQDAIEFVEATFGLLLTNRRSMLSVVVSPKRNSVSVTSSANIVDAWLEDRGFVTHAHAEVLANR